jgi:hypothetical protein
MRLDKLETVFAGWNEHKLLSIDGDSGRSGMDCNPTNTASPENWKEANMILLMILTCGTSFQHLKMSGSISLVF